MDKAANGIKNVLENFSNLSRVHERYGQTTSRLSALVLIRHLYANDTQLLCSMRLEEFDSRKLVFECSVSSVQQWCARRRLQLNEDKSELIWFASRCMLKELTAKNTTMTVGSAIIKSAESVRNLGVVAVVLDS